MQILFSDYWGAGVATDLVNTSPQVRQRTGEALGDLDALVQFLAEREIRPDALEGDRRPTAEDLGRVHSLRRDVRDILESPSEEHVAEGAAELVARAGTRPTLQRDGEGRWRWYATTSQAASVADELAALVGMGLLSALHGLGHDRFRHCGSSECDGMFVDTSRAGRRRYCMPELCGNRVNVANHRARRSASGA